MRPGGERLKVVSMTRVVSVLDLEWTYPGLEDVLEKSNNIFVDWRYSHERKQTDVESGSLLVAVRDIIIEYERDGKTVYQRMEDANDMYLGMLQYIEELRGQDEKE